jgi:hypothetical protein
LSQNLPEKAASLELSVQDRGVAKSVINLVPPGVASKIERLPAEMLDEDESDLQLLLPKKQWTIVDRRLRTSFWIEYNRAIQTNSVMNMTLVYGGICARGYFYTAILDNPARLAYLLQPPTNYSVAMEESLMFGLNGLRECLGIAIEEFKSQRDPKMLSEIAKIVNNFDLRQKGAVVQRIQQHNINENVSTPKDGKQDASMDDIERELAALRKQVLTPAIEITGSSIIVTEDEDA